MGCTVHNIRGFAHKDSGGQSLVFPDVCKTGAPPAGPIPIPYPNMGRSADTSDGTTTVEADGSMIMNKGAKYSKSSLDEAGQMRGVISNKVQDVCEFMMYSFDTMLEGKNVCRMGDPLWHNSKNIMG